MTRPRYALHCFATHVETKSAPKVFVLQCYYYGVALAYFKRHRTAKSLYAHRASATKLSCCALSSRRFGGVSNPFSSLQKDCGYGRYRLTSLHELASTASAIKPSCYAPSSPHFGDVSNPFPSLPRACHIVFYLWRGRFGL